MESDLAMHPNWAAFFNDIEPRYAQAKKINLGDGQAQYPSAGLAEHGIDQDQGSTVPESHIETIEEAHREVTAWQADRDRLETKFDWQFTTADAHKQTQALPSEKTTCRGSFGVIYSTDCRARVRRTANITAKAISSSPAAPPIVSDPRVGTIGV